jgi:hypothetical protein
MKRLLDRVGIAFAQIDLRRKEHRPGRGPQVVHPDEAEICLV